jgi:predicted ferric reductase
MLERKWVQGIVVLVPLALAVTFLVEWMNTGLLSTDGWAGHVGDLLALLGMVGLVMMVGLGTRLPLVEKAFGLDRVYRFHKVLGAGVLTIFFAHALLRTLVYSQKHGEAWAFFWGFAGKNWALAWGHWAFFGLVFVALLAILGRRKLSFWMWKNTHLLVYPAVLLGFVHAAVLGKKDLGHLPNLVVYVVLAVLLLGFTLARVWVYFTRVKKSLWLVDQVGPASRGATVLRLKPQNDRGAFARRRAGQFAILRVRQGQGWSAPHPFTITSPPHAEYLEFTIKAQGRFTSSVAQWKPGTQVLCEGPFGVFDVDPRSPRRLVMISAGVGITPFLSILRWAAHQGLSKSFVLFSANRTHDDLIAAEELVALTEKLDLKVVHLLSRPEKPLESHSSAVIFLQGRLEAALMKEHAEFQNAEVLLCGPTSLQKALVPELKRRLGVKSVRREVFFF